MTLSTFQRSMRVAEMALTVAVVVIMAVARLDLFGFRVAVHHGLDHLAQRVFLQGAMGGEEARQPGEHQRLHRHHRIALAGVGFFRISRTARQRVGEQFVERADDRIGRAFTGARLLLFQNGAGVQEEAIVERFLKRVGAAFFVEVAAPRIALPRRPRVRDGSRCAASP